jgi:plasmid maintenance system antidote protein VapI
MSADFWMNLQARWDLHLTKRSEEEQLQMIKAFDFKGEFNDE